MGHLEAWKTRARQLKTETYARYLACRDPRTPWYGRLSAALVVGYAFSPIDLIPDFVSILGYLDDLMLVPLGIFLALKMIPPQVLRENQEQAKAVVAEGKPISRTAALLIVPIWLLLAALAVLPVASIVK
jgi:uncharacterized membrane protein YkvA (DUF1232 family)